MTSDSQPEPRPLNGDETYLLSGLRHDREKKLREMDQNDWHNAITVIAFKNELFLLDKIEQLQPGATTDSRSLEQYLFDQHSPLPPEQIAKIAREVEERYR